MSLFSSFGRRAQAVVLVRASPLSPTDIERRYVAGRPPHFAGYRVYELVADLAFVVIPKSKPLVAFTGDESHGVRLRRITTASSPAASLSSCRRFVRRPASAGPGSRAVPAGSGTASEPKDAPVSDVGSITQRDASQLWSRSTPPGPGWSHRPLTDGLSTSPPSCTSSRRARSVATRCSGSQ